MATLTQGSLTLLQNSNYLLNGPKKQHPRALSHLALFRKSPAKPVKRNSYFLQQVKCVKTGSNSGRRNQFVEPVLAPAKDIELEITVKSASMVVPVEESLRRSMFLSNIDQSVNIYTGGVIFYSANPNFPPEVMIKKLEAAYRNVLVHYDYLAGRLRWNPQQGRLEIDCNSAGAGFVTASSELALSDLGDLMCPNPAFDQLATRKWDHIWPKDQPLFILQVTSFKCGGIAIGLNLNHTTLDGIGLHLFLEHLSSLVSNNPELPLLPYNNRHLLDARSPPCVTHSHPEMVNLGPNTRGYDTSTPTLFISKTDNLQRQIFRLNAHHIKNLKKQAMDLNNINSESYKFSSGLITSFNVITSHIWRCMALSRYNNGEDKEKPSIILFPINIRARLRPRLPATYVGNAVVSGYGMATLREVEEKPFSYLVERVAEGVKRVDDEYVRSSIDWRELNNGFIHGDILLSPWWKIGFNSVEFPWGKPMGSVPSVHQWSNIVILLQDTKDLSNDRVNVFVSLPREEMDKFKAIFYKFIS